MGLPVTTIAAQLNALAQMTAVGGDLHLPTLIIFTNPVPATKGLLIGGITEATFDGYAAIAGLVAGTPYIGVDGNASVDFVGGDFIQTGTTVSEIAYGWALVNVGKTALYMAQTFDTPIPFNAIGRGVTVNPLFKYGQ